LKVESFMGWALEKKEVNISLEENDLKVTAG